MQRLLCLLTIMLALATGLHAQTDTVKLKGAPMTGHLLPLVIQKDMCVYNPNHGEHVYGKEPNVYSLLAGTVSSVFLIGNDHYIIVKSGEIYIVYAELKSCLFKKGDALDQRQLIGYANY